MLLALSHDPCSAFERLVWRFFPLSESFQTGMHRMPPFVETCFECRALNLLGACLIGQRCLCQVRWLPKPPDRHATLPQHAQTPVPARIRSRLAALGMPARVVIMAWMRCRMSRVEHHRVLRMYCVCVCLLLGLIIRMHCACVCLMTLMPFPPTHVRFRVQCSKGVCNCT